MKMETTNAHPIIGIFPTPLPPEGTDPVTLPSFHKRRACTDEHAAAWNVQEPREVMRVGYGRYSRGTVMWLALIELAPFNDLALVIQDEQ
jgi:hypothetical protein